MAWRVNKFENQRPEAPHSRNNYVKQYLDYNMCQSLFDKKLLKVVQKLLVWGSEREGVVKGHPV